MTTSCPPPSISEPSREEQARALCLRLLTGRSRTRAELSGQLRNADTPTTSVLQVLDRLAAVGLVDDADFAEQWVQSRRARAGKSKRALAAELRTKGVDKEVITTALGGIDAGAERGRAEQLVPGQAAAGDAERGRRADHSQAGGNAGAPRVQPEPGVRGCPCRARAAERETPPGRRAGERYMRVPAPVAVPWPRDFDGGARRREPDRRPWRSRCAPTKSAPTAAR